ncbi:MAG: SH3 domain-containing protein, partial [Planctomycetes bacterium]|nr:SH3 domain-containing protein [Planctomycetota bacterium]
RLRRPMVSPCIAAAAKAASARASYRLSFAALFLAITPLAAQAPGAGAPPAGTTPPVPVVTTPPEPAATPVATPVYGRVLVDAVKLRCWPGNAAEPPVFEDTLSKDQIVLLGRSENGFRAVVLPLGPIGYVNTRFTSEAEDGKVTTKGTKVAFRYRPRTSEAPVTQLATGTELHVVGTQEDWLRVRVAGVEAWVLDNEVQVADAADPAVLAGYEAWQQQQRGEVQARLDAIAKQRQQEQADAADLAAVKVVEDAFVAELQKLPADQKFAPIEAALSKLSATLAEASAARSAVASLEKRITTQKWLVEAAVVIESKPPQAEPAPAVKRDELRRFVGIGWLRYESRLGQPGVFFLEKGGQRLHIITCNTGRYDLSLFIDREVGATGPRRHPPTESLSVLDVERLEVLGVASR